MQFTFHNRAYNYHTGNTIKQLDSETPRNERRDNEEGGVFKYVFIDPLLKQGATLNSGIIRTIDCSHCIKLHYFVVNAIKI